MYYEGQSTMAETTPINGKVVYWTPIQFIFLKILNQHFVWLGTVSKETYIL